MIKEALEYLNAKFLASAQLIEAHDCDYSAVQLNLIKAPMATPLTIHSLQGLADYLLSGDLATEASDAFIHVVQPDKVNLVMPLTGGTRQREHIIQVELLQSVFQFGQYMGQEEFITKVQSQFMPTKEREALLKVAGSITAEAVTIAEDDGITQRATARVGIARQATIGLPNPVTLRPYRTFTEIEQPESLFVFRMRAPATLALFEADGGAWRNKAIRDIAFWLSEALKQKSITIIA